MNERWTWQFFWPGNKNVSTEYKMPGMTRKNRKGNNLRKNRKNGNVSRKNRKANNRKNGNNTVVVGGRRRGTRRGRKGRKGSRRAGRR